MTEDGEEIGSLACLAIAFVSGTFLGSVLHDKKLARDCSRAETEDQGRSR